MSGWLRYERVIEIGRAFALCALACGSVACGGLAQTVPYRPPAHSKDAATLVVYQRGGFIDHYVVLDGQRVLGVTTRNSWLDAQVPPGEHTIHLVQVDDPDIYRKVMQVDEFPCFRVKSALAADHAYYVRVRFVSPASEGLVVQGAALDQRAAELKARDDAAARGTPGVGSTALERQQVATQQAGNAGASLIISLANDPDATGPLRPEDLGWTVRVIRDPKDLGAGGKERLKEWSRVELVNPADAQARFDHIRGTMKLACDRVEPKAEIKEADHLE